MWFLTFLVLAPGVAAETLLTLGIDGAVHSYYGNSFHAVNSDGSVKWKFHAHSPILTYTERLNGTIHIVDQTSSYFQSTTNRTYYALDIDGSVLWQMTSLNTTYCGPGARFLSSYPTLYFVCSDRARGTTQIEAIDAGAWKWTKVIQNDALEVDVGPDGGVLVGTGSTLSALQRENGAVKWTLKLDEGHFQGYTVSNGDVYVAPSRDLDSGRVWAEDLLRLSGDDGSILWNVSFGSVKSNWQYRREPISGCHGEVYVQEPAFDGDNFVGLRFFAIDVNGDRYATWLCEGDWKHSTQQRENGSWEDVFVTYSSPNSNWTTVTSFSGTTGRLLWNASIAGKDVVQDIGHDGTVFARDVNSKTGVAIRNGHEAWRAQSFTAATMAMDGTAYLQYWDDTQVLSVAAIDVNGTQKWTYPMVDQLGSALDAQSYSVVV